MNFTFTGLRNAPSAVTLPTPDFTGWTIPEPVNAANTISFSLHSYAATVEQLSIDMGNQVVYRNVIVDESVLITDRAPSGQITIEEPEIGTKDFHSIIAAHTTGAMQLVHGDTAGNILTLDAPVVQLLQPAPSGNQGVAGLSMALRLIPSSGDDEISIALT